MAMWAIKCVKASFRGYEFFFHCAIFLGVHALPIISHNAEFTRRFAVRRNVPEATRGKAQNKRPACALSAIFVAGVPSTRGATAPQRAQRVNFVVRSTAPLRLCFFLFSCPMSRRSHEGGGGIAYISRRQRGQSREAVWIKYQAPRYRRRYRQRTRHERNHALSRPRSAAGFCTS